MANRNKDLMVELQLPKKKRSKKRMAKKWFNAPPPPPPPKKKTLLRCTVLLHSLELKKRIETANRSKQPKISEKSLLQNIMK